MNKLFPSPAVLAVFFIFNLFVSNTTRAEISVDPARVQEIAAMLPAHVTGFGEPITNRAAWAEAVQQHPNLLNFVRTAAKDARLPMPAQPDSLYLEFSRTGNRDHWQNVAASRRARVGIFALAECVENKGRFIQPLEDTIAHLCAEPTWVLPAHDGRLGNFQGKVVDIDLGSSTLARDLAMADYLLGDRLSPATRKLIHDNLERRIFTPWQAVVTGQRHDWGWMHASNNWIAVCLDGVTGSALATLDSPAERAWYIAVAEKKIPDYFTGGFTADGYGVEGIGYWNYGFGNFIMLSEVIRQATGGGIDLMTKPYAAQPALFGLRSEINDGVHTTIADCDPGNVPADQWICYLSRRLGRNAAPWSHARLNDGLYSETFVAFMPTDLPSLQVAAEMEGFAYRTWFPDGGVLICRPGPDSKIPFAVAIKGGNNGVSHGHNDVGSFSVVAGTNMLVCDPGGENYTARTFGPHRYDSKVLNSFGHAVPLVAGQLQRTGKEAHAVVLDKDFTDAADTMKFDLSSAYTVPDLTRLERTFVFQRGESPSLTVHDDVAFSAPETFESTLITWGKIRRKDNELTITDGDTSIHVTVDTQGHPFHLQQQTINEDTENKRKPIHAGIVLDDKVSAAVVTLRITPGI